MVVPWGLHSPPPKGACLSLSDKEAGLLCSGGDKCQIWTHWDCSHDDTHTGTFRFIVFLM